MPAIRWYMPAARWYMPKGHKSVYHASAGNWGPSSCVWMIPGMHKED